MSRRTAIDRVNALGEKSGQRVDPHKIFIDEDRKQKIISDLRKKYAESDAKFSIELNKRVAKVERELNRQTFEEKKKQHIENMKLATNNMEKLQEWTKAVGDELAIAGKRVSKNIASGVDSGINKYLGTYSDYMSGIETRLQGSNSKSFRSITDMISRNIGSSQYVSQQKVLQNLSELVKQGINYNVEQRAFLMTVSDRIATTFDVFTGDLARLIRIQQADSTVARLGLEAQLTQFFNKNFGDTSYLSRLFDTVSASLVGASATLGRDKSVEFEYTVQKWLGSLSSVGVSESTIQQLAQGIGYLGSGGLTELSGNPALQNLLVMASGMSGENYGSLLSGGLTPSSVNKILGNIVNFSKSIAQNNNRVVLSEYAKMFGMNITDLIAMTNLTTDKLNDISENMLKYEQMYSETENQIKNLGSRMTIKNRIDTMFENIMGTLGENIANSAGMYTTWLIADMLKQSTGGIDIPIPIPLVGIDHINIADTMKAGLVAGSLINSMGPLLSGLFGANKLGLSKWTESDIVSKGLGFTGLVSEGTAKTTSQFQFIGDTSNSALYEGSIAGGVEDIATQKITNEQKDIKERIENDISVDIKTIIRLLDSDGIVIRGAHSQMFGGIPEGVSR